MAELTSPHRHYHGLGHISIMLRTFGPSEYWREYVAATFFHDIVYDVHASDNEELSAVSARMWLDERKHDVDVDLVVEMILATKAHQCTERPDINTVIRADLNILWSSPITYRWYASGIRKEYAHVPNADYRKGREQVLVQLSKAVELSEDLGTLYNRAFAPNMNWEIAALHRGEFDV